MKFLSRNQELVQYRLKQAKKEPRRTRQLQWLRKAIEPYSNNNNVERGIHLQIEGGVAYDKDLRNLVENGYLEMTRLAYDGCNTHRYGYQLSHSVLRITDKGRKALERGKI